MPTMNHLQWEMYDLATDPLEIKNLAHSPICRDAEQEVEFVRLKEQIAAVERERLRPAARAAGRWQPARPVLRFYKRSIGLGWAARVKRYKP